MHDSAQRSAGLQDHVTELLGRRCLQRDCQEARGLALELEAELAGSIAPGRVRFAGVQQGFGNVVWVDHGGQVITVYAHLSTIRVRTGDEVKGHAVLGLSGSSGEARGAHLHFEIWRWGREVDPVPLLGGRPRS